MSIPITGVQPGSLAARKGLHPGDALVSMNGQPVLDVLDYRFYLLEPRLELVVETPRGLRRVRFRKDEDADIGLEFATYLMDEQRTCRNQCQFCFIDQMPPGMRPSLYFKDDDSRLSFLFGNYITLTNLSDEEIARIIRLHISPMRISVHTTNPELRCRLMHNRFAGDSLKALERFAEAGIRMDCQLVLCPGLNDGAELQRTMDDLTRLLPAVESVAAVPVGLTRFREGLAPLRLHTPQEAAAVIDAMETQGDRLLAQGHGRTFFPADEFYIRAGREVPDAAFYEDMTQLENGVGMVALLRAEFREALEAWTPEDGLPRGSRLTLATGVSAAPILRGLVDEAQKKWHTLKVEIVPIRNRFFGETINVTGLLTGGDVLEQLRGRAQGIVVIPDVMLRHEGDRFLDDRTPAELEQALGLPVRVTPVGGAALLETLLL